MKLLLIEIFIVQLLTSSKTYNILGIFPIPAKGHFVMFEALFRGLVEKGHEVDVVGHFPLKTNLLRYNDLTIRGSMPIYTNNLSYPIIENCLKTLKATMNYIIDDAGLEKCEIALNTNVLKELKNSKKKYDLIVTELYGCDCMLGFAHVFKAPTISIITGANLPWSNDRLGNPDNPSYITNYFVPFVNPMSLLERAENTVLYLATKLRYSLSSTKANDIARKFFGEDLPDLRDLASKTSLLLVNDHISTNQGRPNVPNVIEVSGLHIPPLKPLPKHLEDAVNITSTKYKGVIYLSMGSMVMTETLPISALTAFCEAFRELPYKVLWKATREKMPAELDIPPNIHFETWMPQVDILCHPNIKLFISHGGLMGTQEAIYCGVPCIGIPLFADQELNLKTSEAMGLVIMVKENDISKETILKAARDILENPSYSTNAKIIAERFKDRPLSPLDTAIYWVEYVIRHKGAPHLRSVGADLPWYQYHLIDVGAILIGAVALCIITIYYTISFMLRILINSTKRKRKND